MSIMMMVIIKGLSLTIVILYVFADCYGYIMGQIQNITYTPTH